MSEDTDQEVAEVETEEMEGSLTEDLREPMEEPPILERREGGEGNRHKRAIFSVPIQVVVSVGRASPSIGELLNMRRDALLPLDTKLDDPVDIMVGKRVIARGELQELDGGDGRLGVRLTEIVDLSEPF